MSIIIKTQEVHIDRSIRTITLRKLYTLVKSVLFKIEFILRPFDIDLYDILYQWFSPAPSLRPTSDITIIQYSKEQKKMDHVD